MHNILSYIHTYWHAGVHRVREEARKQSPYRGLHHIAEKKGRTYILVLRGVGSEKERSLHLNTYIHTYTVVIHTYLIFFSGLRGQGFG